MNEFNRVLFPQKNNVHLIIDWRFGQESPQWMEEPRTVPGFLEIIVEMTRDSETRGHWT